MSNLDKIVTPIVFFDGHCLLCSRSMHWLAKKLPKDSKVSFSTLHSPLCKELGLHKEEPQTMLLVQDGKTLTKSTAVFELFAQLKQPYKFLRLLSMLPTRFTDFCYKIIAAKRYAWFGRHESFCIKDPTLENRVITSLSQYLD